MPNRKTILIFDPKRAVITKIGPLLRKSGFYTLGIENIREIPFLIESNDRIYAILLVEGADSPEAALEMLKALKLNGGGTPIVFASETNEPRKEQNVRKIGIFYYHTAAEGMEVLYQAVISAMDYAYARDIFLPSRFKKKSGGGGNPYFHEKH